jgi:hypothetical protein
VESFNTLTAVEVEKRLKVRFLKMQQRMDSARRYLQTGWTVELLWDGAPFTHDTVSPHG